MRPLSRMLPFVCVVLAAAVGLVVLRPHAQASPVPIMTEHSAIATISAAHLQTPEPPPVPAELTKFWLLALGAGGSLILGIVKFFKGNLAKLPDWAKGVLGLVLPSVIAVIAHLAGYVSLPADLATAVPLLAAGFIGMGLRALLKAFFPALAAATSSS